MAKCKRCEKDRLFLDANNVCYICKKAEDHPRGELVEKKIYQKKGLEVIEPTAKRHYKVKLGC